jgi:2'-5' RNA ligase
MMNHFLGYFLDDKSRKTAVKRVNSISTIFSGMGIQVRWIKPSNYHIKIQNLKNKVGILTQLYISQKIKPVLKGPIDASIGNIKLGTNRNLKGLIYLEIKEGGDDLRKLRYEMLKNLKIKDNVQFIPHIAIGRINKDLSKQEYSNILRDIENVSKQIDTDESKFVIDEIDLVKINNEDYEILKNFVISKEA